MNRKVRLDRLALVVLLGVGLIIALYMGIKAFFPDKTKPGGNTDPTPSATSETVPGTFKMTLMDYEVYQDDDLDFDFAIARVRFEDEKPLEFDLSRFETDQGLRLSEVSSYVKALEDRSLYLGKNNVVYEVVSKERTGMFALLIPYKKGSDTIKVTDTVSKQEFTLDLKQNIHNASDLKYQTGGDIKGDKFDIYISDAFITDILSSGGEEYTYPSTIKVYTFKLNVNSIEGGNVSIVSAVFAPNGSEERFEALDGSYSSIKAGETSLIGKPLSPGTSGVLFFEIYNPEEEGITYEGKIYLQLSDRAEQIEITTRF
ncbi:MAG: hypothetical protein II016_04485 [Erysipelotrichaceae bacterium]|nr:hypothetical protein [Erysipelotrichaceae bacterium]